MYCTITDGVTSANTITVGWSLQNTTPATNFQITTATVGGTVGYANNAVDGVFGTLNSNTSGAALVALYDDVDHSVVRITGATVQSYLTSITVNGVTRTGASATTFSYDATHNLGVWTWTGGLIYGFASGTVYNGLLNHT
jgi:YD repeat-containing protein